MVSPAFPGFFFCFAGTILLVVASVSVPTWNAISFLDVGRTHFGVFGYTGTGTSIGYYFPTRLGGHDMNDSILHHLTQTLVLIPIAAGIAGLSSFFGLFGLANKRFGTIMMAIFAFLAFLVSLVAWVLEMVLFSIWRRRIRESSGDNAADYGHANWIVLGGVVALFLAFIFASCGCCGRYKHKHHHRSRNDF